MQLQAKQGRCSGAQSSDGIRGNQFGACALNARQARAPVAMDTSYAHALNCVSMVLTKFQRPDKMSSVVVMNRKRGSSLCPNCGQSNGNRAVECKACGCSVSTKKAKPVTVNTDLEAAECCMNVTSLLSEAVLPTGSQVYSVRVRDQGPDYRYHYYNSYYFLLLYYTN